MNWQSRLVSIGDGTYHALIVLSLFKIIEVGWGFFLIIFDVELRFYYSALKFA